MNPLALAALVCLAIWIGAGLAGAAAVLLSILHHDTRALRRVYLSHAVAFGAGVVAAIALFALRA